MASLENLPTPMRKLFDAISSNDNTKLASTFAENSVLIDESRTYKSLAEIEAWAQEALVAHKATISIQEVQGAGRSWSVRLMMDGDFVADYGITEPFTLYFHFSLTEGENEIEHLRIDDLAPEEPTMLAVWASRGDPEDPFNGFRRGLRRVPKIPDGWVRVKVAAAGLNFHDIFTLRGIGFHPLTYPLILGNEATGRLDDGSEVIIYPLMSDHSFKGSDITLDPKRHVLGELTQGAFAEYVVVPKGNIIPKPTSLSFEGAATLAISWLTAYRMLFTQSGLDPGQKMLVQGSAGGVATALIQLGVAAGMTVWTTGRSEEKRRIAESHGAHKTFEPGAKLPELVDAVFDLSGAETLNHSIKSVRACGIFVISGLHSGHTVDLDLFRLMTDQIKITGSYLGTREEFESLIAFIVEKNIEIQPYRTISLDMVEDGLKSVYNGDVQGKIVLTFQ